MPAINGTALVVAIRSYPGTDTGPKVKGGEAPLLLRPYLRLRKGSYAAEKQRGSHLRVEGREGFCGDEKRCSRQHYLSADPAK